MRSGKGAVAHLENFFKIYAKIMHFGAKFSLVLRCFKSIGAPAYPLLEFATDCCHGVYPIFTRDCTHARLSYRRGVCLSVRPPLRLSNTLCDCIKTTQARITNSSLLATTYIYFLVTKFHAALRKKFPFNEGVKKGYPP